MSALILISVLGVLVLYLGLFGKKSWLAPVACAMTIRSSPCMSSWASASR